MSIQCTICMSTLSVNEAANAATCGHVFHEPCLVQWFLRSKTCPQCRARCDDRHVRRLYFSAALNSSTADVDSLNVELDDVKLEIRNLRTELAGKQEEVKKLRDRQEKSRLAFLGLESKLKLKLVECDNIKSENSRLTNELQVLRAVEKSLNEEMQKQDNFAYIKSVIESKSADIAELLQTQPDVKVLATLVSVSKSAFESMKRSKDEVNNHRRVCQEENAKLRKRIKELQDKISTLDSDNNKLKDDLSQMQRNNQPNTSRNEDALTSSATSSSLQPSLPATRSNPSTPSATTRTDSPYLQIRQSNVGLTPLLHRKRKPDAVPSVGPFNNMSIFSNPRKVSRVGGQGSSTIYNGVGGSERKENFLGFPNGQSLGSSRNGVNRK